MKEKIKKIIPKQTAPILVIIFGFIMLTACMYNVYAVNVGLPVLPWNIGGAGNPSTPTDVIHGVAAGAPLTAALWNGLVNKVDELGSTWKLAAKSTDVVEEAKIDIYNGFAGIETDHGYTRQTVNPHVFYFPTNANQIMFTVRYDHDHFCVGGRGVLDLLGTGVEGAGTGRYPHCIEREYRGTGRNYYVRGHTANWAQLYINGNPMYECVSPEYPYGSIHSVDPVAYDANPGRFLYNGNGVAYGDCLYVRGTAVDGKTWTGNVTALRVEEADWSDHYGGIAWEIWYK